MNTEKHGLTGTTKRLVFDALLARQQGKCFICGISQAELEAKRDAYALKWNRALAPVHWKLHIDHCHATKMIRGLLCERCNHAFMWIENYAFGSEPLEGYMLSDFFERCDRWLGPWIEQHMERILLYMQRDRWLPRKDILFHLQEVT